MKKFFLSWVAMIVATMSYAQGSLIATLSHEGEISAFYGANALKSAMEAAETGDVITLSSGQFNAVEISKPVTLRGAGMSVNTSEDNPHEATVIQGEFSINIPEEATERLVVEGMYFNNDITYGGVLENAQFQKCRFRMMAYDGNGILMNTSFIHCRISFRFLLGDGSNVVFVNSVVSNPNYKNSDSGNSASVSSNVEFDNCYVQYGDQAGVAYYSLPNHAHHTYYKNCIILTRSSSSNDTRIPSSSVCYNCIGMGSTDIFINMRNTTNYYVAEPSSVFKAYTKEGTGVPDSISFELTDEAAAIYLGTDGTQVGVYGGNLPYNEDPTIPQIVKFNAASKSSADGKLNVGIEVKDAEYSSENE